MHMMESALPQLLRDRKVEILLGYYTIAALHVHSLGQRTKAGSAERALACMPVFLCNLFVPFLFDRHKEPCLSLIMVFGVTWQANFKVAGLCVSRGSLCQKLDFMQFWAALWLPIGIQRVTHNPLNFWVKCNGEKQQCEPGHAPSGSPAEGMTGSALMLAGALAKAAALGAMVYIRMRLSLPSLVEEALQAMMIYAYISAMMDGLGGLVLTLIGLHITPHFDKPFLSTSIREFWSQRWNLVGGGSLRMLVYDPMVEGCLVKRPGAGRSASKVVRRLAMAATFVASGLVHEMMFWYVKGYMPGISGGWLLWFTLQSPLLLAESTLRTWAQCHRIRVPAVLGNALTWVVLLGVAHWTYLRQDAVSGLQEDCRQDLQRTYGPLWSRMQRYLGQA